MNNPVSWCNDTLGDVADTTGGKRMFDRKHRRRCWCPCREEAELNKEWKWALVKLTEWLSTGNWTGGNMRFHCNVRRPGAECKKNKTKNLGGGWTTEETGWQKIHEEMRGAEEELKRKRSEQKLRQSGWVRYEEIDVLSLHLQPQKCQVCGELRWSESSSASLQPRLKHTYVLTLARAHTHKDKHTKAYD